VTFNGIAATPTGWSATSIGVKVPAGATTGNVVVTVGGVASNGVELYGHDSVASITSLNPTFGGHRHAGDDHGCKLRRGAGNKYGDV